MSNESQATGEEQAQRRVEIKTGNITGSTGIAIGTNIKQTVNVYQLIRPQPIAAAEIAAANAKLTALPLDHVPPVATLPAGSQIPLRYNPLFVGREGELRDLAACLKAGETAAVGQTAAATGMGGIGKTQLAVAFAHHYGHYFAGGVFWIPMADAAAIPAEVAACGFNLAALGEGFASLELEAQVRLVLSHWQSALPRLLIFDNCEDESLLAQWRPPTGGARVLVTSRRSSWAAGLAVRALPLPTLPRAQSVELLQRFPAQASPPVPPFVAAEVTTLAQIAETLGDLPLALHLAGSFLARYRHSIAPAAYLEQLRSPTLLDHPSLHFRGYNPTGHEQHVARTFALSYEHLDPHDPLDALAIALLARSAHFFAGEPIPRRLLLATVGAEEDDLAATLQAEDALQRLGDLGLVALETNGAVRLHRLLATFVLTAASEMAEDAQSTVESTVLAEADRLNQAGIPGPLLAWQIHLRHITETARWHGDERAARLCHELGFHLEMTGDYSGALSYNEEALAIRRTIWGEQHPATALSFNNLGVLLQKMGKYEEAQPYNEKALVIRRQVLGDRHPDTAQSLINFGALLQAMGNYEGALSNLEEALATNRAVLGERHPDTAQSLINLGALLQVMGNYEGALSNLEEALTIRSEMLGKQHPDTANSLVSLGGLWVAKGELHIARPYFEEALGIQREMLGKQHPNTILSLNDLGYLLQAMGELTAAKPYFEEALALTRVVLGGQHPETATSLHNYGGLLHALGDSHTAKSYHEEALEINRMVFGDKHPYTARSLNNLGYLLLDMGEHMGAKEYYEKTLAIRMAVLGKQHPDTARSLNNLGVLLQEMGELNTAQEHYEKAFAIRRQVLGKRHPETANSLNNMGYLLQTMGEPSVAKEYYKEALAILEEKLGLSHPETMTVRQNLESLDRANDDGSVE